MEYRSLGNTGLTVSEIGLGAEHMVDKPFDQVKRVMDASLDVGINIIDVFMPQEQVRLDIAKAIKGKRNQVILQGHIGSVVEDGQPGRSRELSLCKKYFEDLLRLFETDYIDLGMMFFVDTDKDYAEAFETGYLDYVLQLKKEGKIRFIGASTHNPEKGRLMVESGVVDMLMVSINPAYDMLPPRFDIYHVFGEAINNTPLIGIEPSRAALYELCEQKGVGITVMKTFGGGRLLSAALSPFSKALTTGQCIHYALSRPAVASCLIGCQDEAEVQHAAKYFELSESEKDFSGIAEFFKDEMKGKCMYCNHCLPCPAKIDIAALTKLLDIARLGDAVPHSIRAHYKALDSTAVDCIECGQCETNCPFQVQIIDNMRLAKELFA